MKDFIDFASPDLTLETFSPKQEISKKDLQKQLLEENGIQDPNEITSAIVKNNLVVKQLLENSVQDTITHRFHYKNKKGEMTSWFAYDSIFRSFDHGEFPYIIHKKRLINDPLEIRSLPPVNRPNNIQEKMLQMLRDQYNWTYKEEDESEQFFQNLKNNKEERLEYLQSVKEWLTRDEGQYAKLLHPAITDTEAEKEKKEKRLSELATQSPCIIIAEGQEYLDKGQTYTQQKGAKPITYFPVEERIMDDIDLGKIKK